MSTYIEKSRKTIPPLLSTTWGINAPYRIMMPARNNGYIDHYPPGCNAVALAQMVFYYARKYYDNNMSFNVGGGGSNFSSAAYNPTRDVINNQKYNWSSIKNSYNYYEYISSLPTSTWNSTLKAFIVNNNSSAKEVATLMYDCMRSTDSTPNGGSVRAYGRVTTVSGALKYKLNMGVAKQGDILKYTYNGSTSFRYLEEYIYNELQQGRPVFCEGFGNGGGYYSGADEGHIYIIDGYNNGLFHINFGWGGKADGYYKLNVQGTGLSGYSSEQGVITDPCYNYLYVTRVYPSIDYKGNTIVNNVIKVSTPNKTTVVTSDNINNVLNDIIVINVDLSLCDGISRVYDKNNVVITDTKEKHKQIIKFTIKNKSRNTEYYLPKIGICVESTVINREYISILPNEEMTITIPHVFNQNQHNTGLAIINFCLLGNSSYKLKDSSKAIASSTIPLKPYNTIGKYPTLSKLDFTIMKYGYSQSNANYYRAGDNDIYIVWNNKNGTKEVNPNNFDIIVPVSFWFRYTGSGDWNGTRYNEYKDNALLRTVLMKFPAKGKAFELLTIIRDVPRNQAFDIRIEGSYLYYNDALYRFTLSRKIIVDNVIISYDDKGYKTVLEPDIPTNNVGSGNYISKEINIPEDSVAVDLRGVGAIKKLTSNSNPNTLYYFNSNQTIPNSFNNKNVIIDGIADKITIDVNYPFMVPITFEAESVAAVVNYLDGYSKGDTNLNWKTIAFPFDVSEIICDGKEITWFKSNSSEGCFWLKKFGGIKVSDTKAIPIFEDVDSINQYCSYIINIPGKGYGKYSLINKNIYFKGKDVKFNRSTNIGVFDLNNHVVENETLLKENVLNFEFHLKNDECFNVANFIETTNVIDFIGTTVGKNEHNCYILNKNGSAFEYTDTVSELKPFNAYFKDSEQRKSINEDILEKNSPSRVKRYGNNNNDNEVFESIVDNEVMEPVIIGNELK